MSNQSYFGPTAEERALRHAQTSVDYWNRKLATMSNHKERESATYYKSCTHGRMPMSPTGKELMQDYRKGVQRCIDARKAGYGGPKPSALGLQRYIGGLIGELGAPLPYSAFSRMYELITALYGATDGAILAHDFCANGKALSRARGHLALYISELEEKVKSMEPIKTTCPDADADSDGSPASTATIHKLVQAVLTSHGRPVVEATLRMFGTVRVPDLRLRDVGPFTAKLREIQATKTPEMAAFEAAHKAVIVGSSRQRDQQIWDAAIAYAGRTV